MWQAGVEHSPASGVIEGGSLIMARVFPRPTSYVLETGFWFRRGVMSWLIIPRYPHFVVYLVFPSFSYFTLLFSLEFESLLPTSKAQLPTN